MRDDDFSRTGHEKQELLDAEIIYKLKGLAEGGAKSIS